MAYLGPVTKIYRQTSIGLALEDTLDQFEASNEISPALREEIQAHFDANVLRILSTGVATKITFRGAKIICYRFCQDVWTFVLDSPTFKTDHGDLIVCNETVKIVALDQQKLQNPNFG